MANQIQIKRSTTTATPGSLANGELAFSSNGNVLFIGANGVVEPIAGKRTPGVLTANQALVANATSGIDKVIVANLVPTAVYANGASGTAGQIFTSNSSGGVYWASPAPTTAGSNTQVQFNDEGALSGDADFTFNKTTNTLTVTNIAGNGASITSVNASAVGGNTVADLNTYADNKAANAYSNAMSDTLSRSGSYTGNNTFGGTDTVITSNVTISGTINRAPTITLAGDLTGSVTLTDLANGTLTATIAADSVALGTDTTGNYVATITAGAGISGASSAEGGTPTIAVVANNGITANSSGVFVNGQDGLTTNSTGVFVKAGTGVTVNATGVHIGQAVGTTDNVTFNDITINGNTTIGSNSSDVVSVNGRINTALVPAANVTYDLGSTTMRWKDLYLSGSSIQLGNVTITDTSGTLTVNSVSIPENLTVNGNTALGSNSSDVVSINAVVNTSITPSANVTYDLGTNTSRWKEIHAANVHSVDGYFDGNLQVSGNLVVLGDALTVNVSSLAVEDSLIQLATNNTSTDLLDIGFYGNYQVGGGGHEHAGLFRDASDDGIFKIFYGLQDGPTTTVNIAGTGYTQGTIQAYLKSGALISNATHVAITANSTVNVAITANTISLATALASTDGGTGFDTYTSGDLLVANTGNALSKLSLGTDGYVLQSNGTALIYNTLDGGSF